jgi:hypothetical protein
MEEPSTVNSFSPVRSKKKDKMVVLFWRAHSIGRLFQMPFFSYPCHMSSLWPQSLCCIFTRLPVCVPRINFVCRHCCVLATATDTENVYLHCVCFFVHLFLLLWTELYVICSPFPKHTLLLISVKFLKHPLLYHQSGLTLKTALFFTECVYVSPIIINKHISLFSIE